MRSLDRESDSRLMKTAVFPSGSLFTTQSDQVIDGGYIFISSVCLNLPDEYWMVYHTHLKHFGAVELILSHHQSGQGASERFHTVEKR